MNERINLDLEAITDDGNGLYVAYLPEGVHIFEARPETPAHIDGDYLTPTNENNTDVYVTTIADDGTIEIFAPDSMDLIDTITDDELDGNYIPTDVLNEYGLRTLELIN